MFNSLPTEIQLDVLKFLSYEELISIKQTNLYFRDFINNFEDELTQEESYYISIDYYCKFKEDPHEIIKPKAGDFESSLNGKIINKLKKWENGFKNPVPLYLYNSIENIVICLESYFLNHI